MPFNYPLNGAGCQMHIDVSRTNSVQRVGGAILQSKQPHIYKAIYPD
jgi:hypothetical protein